VKIAISAIERMAEAIERTMLAVIPPLVVAIFCILVLAAVIGA
jgi:hypothetical protein